jgi:hypothetical protein
MKNKTYILIYLAIITLFLLNRIGPIISQSLPYTYDQGRDFQRAANLVENLDPVFIGPTTGIEGIFHGAWWYYYLAIPYILFGGLPLGFYISNLLVHLTSLLLLMYFLFRYFDKKISFLIGVLISTSPYFIFNSIFVGNNIMVLPAMVVFLITHFIIIEFLPKKSWKKALLFLTTGLSLGFIAEFEFAFGLLLAPIYLLLILGINFLRKIFFTRFTFPYLFLGILFAFIPRILFEIKNDFSQTIKLINYFFNPTSFVYKSIQDRFFERVDLFLGFYQGIFFNQLALLVVTPICLFILYVFFRKRRPLIFSKSLTFFTLLVTGLFLISLYYKDNFWNYYYEGLPYIFAFILAIILTSISKIKFPNLNWVLHLTIFIAIFISLYNFIIGLQKENKIDGLAKTNKVVEFIHQNEENLENYCVIIYTPPAIPYTYNYIFYYKERSENIPYPKDGWAENKCWFIIEADSNKERRQSWIKDRIPENSKLLIEKNIEDILIQKREYVNN